ncbi:MAG: DNA repair protein RadA [Spirochaetales bacterium]|nr:DNA repair protein RadA [Candidatus Physcosoma equi]
MKGNAVRYVCRECGHEETKWAGRCPECGSWNTFDETEVQATPKAQVADASKTVIDSAVHTLSDIPYEKTMRVSSGIEELDRVLGGGVMRPSAVLVGGEPGIGKSTIMIQMISNLSKESPVLYVSGEESPSQVKMRAERLGLDTSRIQIYCDTRLEALLNVLETTKPGYVVVDSLQTLSTASVASSAGSPNQIKTCCMELSLTAKKLGAAIFFVGHVTKEGMIAGPKIVEHMVDTVLYFENAESGMRLLRASKSRFGSVDEIGLFEMQQDGLKGVKDPSQYFLSSREKDEFPAGISFTPVVEGSRTFVVEVQALVVPARSGYQRIYSDRIDNGRINRIAAILERHAGLNLSDQDIYVNVAGGMRLSESSVDLAVALALYSSKMDVPLASSLSAFGELSLAGEVRPIPFVERRLKALSELGFTKCVTATGNSVGELQVDRAKNIRSAIAGAFKHRD